MSDERIGVALVIDALERGGAERVLVAIANGLDHTRLRVVVVTTRWAGPLAEELHPAVKLVSLERDSRFDLRAMGRLVQALDREGIRIVHTHSHSAGWFTRVAQLLHRRRWIHIVHDHYPLSHQSRTVRMLDRLFLSRADCYVAVSDPLARYAAAELGIPAGKIEKVRNGVPVGAGRPPAREGPFTIVQVARVEPQKNQLHAVAVAARLRALGVEFRWYLVGRAGSDYAGAVREAIGRANLEQQVLLLGEQPETRTLVEAAHAGVLTSMGEGMPVALLEYLAVGLPVAVTDVGDCGELVRAADCGWVGAVDDAEAMAVALRDLAADPANGARLGENGRRHVREHYSDQTMNARIEAIYEKLLAPQRGITGSGSAADVGFEDGREAADAAAVSED